MKILVCLLNSFSVLAMEGLANPPQKYVYTNRFFTEKRWIDQFSALEIALPCTVELQPEEKKVQSFINNKTYLLIQWFDQIPLEISSVNVGQELKLTVEKYFIQQVERYRTIKVILFANTLKKISLHPNTRFIMPPHLWTKVPFVSEHLHVNVKGPETHVDLNNIKVKNCSVTVDNGELLCNGEVELLYVTVSNNGLFNGEGFKAKVAHPIVANGGIIDVNVIEKLISQDQTLSYKITENKNLAKGVEQ